MQVHRFQDAAAISLKGEGETRYLTAAEAEKIGNALLDIARSIRREQFADSPNLSVPFETFESTREMPMQEFHNLRPRDAVPKFPRATPVPDEERKQ